MNGGIRRFFHRRVEFPALVRLGLRECAGKDVLELGCGNGFGAELIASLGPRSKRGFSPDGAGCHDRRPPSVEHVLSELSLAWIPHEGAPARLCAIEAAYATGVVDAR